jgi:tetratricopeptide (TPR) repeat protein
MISSPSSAKRQVVPRWRSLSTTIAANELSHPLARNEPVAIRRLPEELVYCIEQWRRAPGLLHAAELVEAALVYSHESEAVDAARLLIRADSKAVPLVRKQAALLLKRTHHNDELPPQLRDVGEQNTLHLWRARTRLHPHDALAWVELALAQVADGREQQAERSMRVALQLAPFNRHVLRSAARLYFVRDAGRAHDLIRLNEVSQHDPWLMAAEIAIAEISDLRPTFVKRGMALLESGAHRPREISELAGALGSKLLMDGNGRRGRRLLRQSLLDPTGNSLAQVEWASQNFGAISAPKEDSLQKFGDATEALTLNLSQMGKFEHSLVFARHWIDEEPASLRAHFVASGIANTIERYETGFDVAVKGLRLNPYCGPLINGAAFALACLGRIGEAEKMLRRIDLQKTDPILRSVATATWGLIALRRGDQTLGTRLYCAAIEGFHRSNAPRVERLAKAYFAREAMRANLPDAEKILADAESDKTSSPEADAVLEAARRAFLENHSKRSA